MKKLLFLIPVVILLQSCSSKTHYNSSKVVNSKNFDCASKDVTSENETVIIKANDLKECFIENNKKIVWLYFYYQNCPTQDISYQINQKNIFEKYKDKMDYVVISETFDFNEVKKTEKSINHPINFVDPSYSEKRLQNSRGFLAEALGDNTTEEALVHTSIFIYEGKVIGAAYTLDLTDEFIEQMLSKQ